MMSDLRMDAWDISRHWGETNPFITPLFSRMTPDFDFRLPYLGSSDYSLLDKEAASIESSSVRNRPAVPC